MKLVVGLGERSYDILINEPVSFTDTVKQRFAGRSFVIVTNTTIAELYKEELQDYGRELDALLCTIEDGEQYKNFDTLNTILDTLLESKFDRKTVIIAFGGGVVGDITGFAASIFLRGVEFVQVPTTLLAMVDSSVGGKTGINHDMGKNLIGSFHQPSLVWIENRFLRTLPEREFIAGMGEVFKYGFIGGMNMLYFIADNREKLLANSEAIVESAIRRSVEIKAKIVEEDEKESGVRALLNFGHTFGHALERYYKYTGILHGEGIYWGIKCAITLGKKVGTVGSNDIEMYDSLVDKLPLPVLPNKPDCNELYRSMFSDKKTVGGNIRFILPTTPGSSKIVGNIDKKLVIDTLEEVFG